MKRRNPLDNKIIGNIPIKHFLLITSATFILLFAIVFNSMAGISNSNNELSNITSGKSSIDTNSIQQ